MKTSTQSLIVRGAIATILLALGFARVSQRFDPVMAPARHDPEPTRLSGPTIACHNIEKPADKLV